MRVIVLFLALIPFMALAQTEYLVNNFSDKYYARIFVDADGDKHFPSGVVKVYSSSKNEKLIEISSNYIDLNLNEDGSVRTNVKEMPYGEQSVIIYEDFNFDGVKDLAIMDGPNSCYGDPSFQIYLDLNDELVLNQDFTALAQYYCGMFGVNSASKTLSTMTKSGCCHHEYSTFAVKNNKPVLTDYFSKSIDRSGLMVNYVKGTTENGKYTSKRYSVLELDGSSATVSLLFKFQNGKTVRLIEFYSTLTYIFTDKDNIVELSYSDDFVYSHRKKELSFQNENTEYIISNKGMVVKFDGKVVNMPALEGSLEGTIEYIGTQEDWHNVKFVQ